MASMGITVLSFELSKDSLKEDDVGRVRNVFSGLTVHCNFLYTTIHVLFYKE